MKLQSKKTNYLFTDLLTQTITYQSSTKTISKSNAPINKHLKIILLICYFLIIKNGFAQCPYKIKTQGSGNTQPVTLIFTDIPNNYVETCECYVDPSTGNINCPNNCGGVIPTNDFSTITYIDSVTNNNCLYNNEGILIAALPIELVYFNAKIQSEKVTLSWAKASESNNNYFTIEKTTDFINFCTVTTADGAHNSNTKREYIAYDNNPSAGISYYRLKQTDFNGEESFSDFRKISFKSASDFSFSVFPHPGTINNMKFSIQALKNTEATITVYDLTGREIYSTNTIIEQSEKSTFALDTSAKLESGIYFVTVNSNGNSSTNKIVVQ